MRASLALLATTWLVGCRCGDGAGSDTEIPTGATPLSGQPVEAAQKSLAELEAPVSALRAKFAELHKRFDALPGDLPEFGPARERFYGTDEALGRLTAKLSWLADRLDKAVKSGNQQELDEVSEDIQNTFRDIREIDKIALQLTHVVPAFERMHKRLLAEAEAKNAGAAGAGTAPASPSAAGPGAAPASTATPTASVAPPRTPTSTPAP